MISTGTPAWDGLLVGASLATLAGDSGYGVVEDGAIGWLDGALVYVGERNGLPDAPEELAGDVTHVDGWITPALVDCHTHLVFAGDRAAEFERRLQGASYEAIAKAGGGILSTVQATRAAGEEDLFAASLPRARALRDDGVTTLEIKSGYGLDFENERKMLRVARRIGEELGVTVRTTFLGAHALPPEYAGRGDAYIDAVCDWLPRLHGEGLVDAVDAFCEGIGFSPAQTRRVFEAARGLGLPVKLHADQLSDLGGAALAAEFGGCRPITSNTRRRRACGQWPTTVRSRCFCRVHSTCCVKRGYRRLTNYVRRGCRWRWRRTAIRARRRCNPCGWRWRWPARISG